MDGPLPGGVYGVNVGLGDQKRSTSGDFLGADLFNCVYGALGTRRMIKTGSPDPPNSYELLRGITNLNMLCIEDFLVVDGVGWLVLEPADEKFIEWVQRSEKLDLFIKTSAGKWRLSPVLRSKFIELASLIDVLIKEDLHIPGLGIGDLYMKTNAAGESTLKVLLSDNVIWIGSAADVTAAMAPVRDIIDACCQFHGVQLDDSSIGFKNYFGRLRTVKHLEMYPDSWSDEDKECYIFMIIHHDMATMSNAITSANVNWPWHRTSTRYNRRAIPIVADIRRHHWKRATRVNYPYLPWNYIQMCRNVLKSFDIPPWRKGEIPGRSAFLRLMEKWNRWIWTSLYERIGPLESV